MKVIIDRFEGDFAVVELPGRKMVNMPKELVPDAKEGDAVSIEIDKRQSEMLMENNKKLMGEVWND